MTEEAQEKQQKGEAAARTNGVGPPPSAKESGGSFEPILAEHVLRRRDALFNRLHVRGHVGLVVVSPRGDSRCFMPDRRPTLGELLWGGSGTLYEVDMGLKHTTLKIDLPTLGDRFSFTATVHLEWQVVNPSTVVRNGVFDVRKAFTPPLREKLSRVTRKIEVGAVTAAEEATSAVLEQYDVGTRYGFATTTYLQLRTDESTLKFADNRRAATQEIEIDLLKDEHSRQLLTIRMNTYRAIIAAGDIDQFALQLVKNPDTVGVLKLMRDERNNDRKQIVDFVTELLRSGAIEKWQISDHIQTALEWLSVETNEVIKPTTGVLQLPKQAGPLSQTTAIVVSESGGGQPPAATSSTEV